MCSRGLDVYIDYREMMLQRVFCDYDNDDEDDGVYYTV